MSGPGGYGNPQNQQQMYGHQQMPRTGSSGQLNNMMQHPGMMMPSSQSQMMNQQSGVMVSQGYSQNMGQPMPQIMQSMGPQSHMGQPMGQGMMQQSTHMGQAQQMPQTSHMNVAMSQQQSQGGAQHMSSQSVYMQQQQHHQQQQPSSQSMYAQPRSPRNVAPQLSQMTGPASTGGPASNNPQTPMNPASANPALNPASMNPASQQGHPTPATPQQAPSSVQSVPAQEIAQSSSDLPPDPIAVARLLILKDLRHSMEKLSTATSEYFGQSRSLANPSSANPQSVNPQSVNPLSVNPLSVNPSSVKSEDPKSVEGPDKKTPLAPKDAYNSAMDDFMAVCDQIEMNLLVIQEAHKQCKTFDKMFSGELKSVGEMANVNYSQFAQGYIEPALRTRKAINRTIDCNNSILQKLRESRVDDYDSNPQMDTDE